MEELLKIAENARKGERETEDRLPDGDKDRIIEEILKLLDPDFEKFFNELFNEIVDWENHFYETVHNLRFYIGYREQSDHVFSKLWIYAYQKIDRKETRERFLNDVTSEDERYVWDMIGCLAGFCEKVEVPAPFAANWFYDLTERVKNDLAGGGIYDGIKSYVLQFASGAFEIFDIYLKDFPNSTKEGLAGYILGLLRCVEREKVQGIDSYLKESDDAKHRNCYFNSFFMTYKEGGVSLEELKEVLEIALSDLNEQVRDTAYWIVSRGLINGRKEFKGFGISWLKKHCSQSISGVAKHHIISSMWHVCSSRKERSSSDIENANTIIASILPVPIEQIGTLDELSHYLCYSLATNDEFTAAVKAFVLTGTDNLICLCTNEHFEHFRHEVEKLELTDLITYLVFSGDYKQSKLGLLLLDYAQVEYRDAETLPKVSEERLSIALSQFTTERNLNETIAKKIRFIEPFFRIAQKPLQDDFVDEMVIQAANYAQGCLEELKISKRSSLLTAVIERAERYFEGYKVAKNSPANGFSFPGYEDACRRAQQHFHAKIHRLAREKSVFLSAVHNVALIYGKTFSFTVGHEISNPSPMVQFEKSMELPRIELIDPEGMHIRRIGERE